MLWTYSGRRHAIENVNSMPNVRDWKYMMMIYLGSMSYLLNEGQPSDNFLEQIYNSFSKLMCIVD